MLREYLYPNGNPFEYGYLNRIPSTVSLFDLETAARAGHLKIVHRHVRLVSPVIFESGCKYGDKRILNLPGIRDSTQGAIQAIQYNQREIFLDLLRSVYILPSLVHEIVRSGRMELLSYCNSTDIERCAVILESFRTLRRIPLTSRLVYLACSYQKEKVLRFLLQRKVPVPPESFQSTAGSILRILVEYGFHPHMSV